MTEKVAWVRNILAMMGVSAASLVGAGFYFGTFKTEVTLGQDRLEKQIAGVAEQTQAQIKQIAEATKVQVTGIAEDTKKQIADAQAQLADKIKDGNANLEKVANANSQAVTALSTLSATVATGAAQNSSQDREIDDIRRSLRDLNQTLGRLNDSLRFLPVRPPDRQTP